VLVGCSWRGVDEEIVKRGPQYVGQELPHHCCFLWSAPDHGRGAGGEEEGEGGGVEGSYWGLLGSGGGGGVAVCSCVIALIVLPGLSRTIVVEGDPGSRIGKECLRSVHLDRDPASRCLLYLCVFEPEEAGDRGAG